MSNFAHFIYHTLRIFIGMIFLWSGVSKAFNPAQFTATIEAYGLLPDLLILPTALTLILLEIVAAIGLLFDKWGSLTAIAIMMLLFLTVLGYGIFLGLDIDCGCFGPNDPEAKAFHDLRGAFVRDLWLMLAIIYLYLSRFINRLAPHPWMSVRN
jgi:uncharacterized membrane protein YphA (DoxX/SURF4 family)